MTRTADRAAGERRAGLSRVVVAALASLVVLGAGCGPSSLPRSVGHPLVGASAPRFREASTSERDVGLPADDRTRVTVIDFWASWCAACQETIPALDDLWRDRKHSGVMVIGVSVDESVEAAASAAQQMGATFPIVVDQRLASRYAVGKIPLTFVVDGAGTVRWVGRDPGDMRRAVEFVLNEQ